MNIDMDNKITFLKAVLLGIHYGRSDNSEYYKKSIEREIHIIHQKSSEEDINLNTKENLKKVENIAINTILNKIVNLENQKNYVMSLIQKLSFNYVINIHKISF